LDSFDLITGALAVVKSIEGSLKLVSFVFSQTLSAYLTV